MPLKLSVNQIFIAAIVLSFAVLLTILGIYKQQDDHRANSAALLSAAQELLLKTERFAAVAAQVETSSRAYSLTGQPAFITTYQGAKREVLLLGDTLDRLLAPNQIQKAALDSLLTGTNNRIAFADSLLALVPALDRTAALSLVGSGRGLAYLSNTKRFVDIIQKEERKLLALRSETVQRENGVARNLVLSAAFVVLALLALLFWKEKKYYKFTRDVTARRKLSHEIETLHKQINQANDAIYTLDAGLHITSWNLGAEKLYGYTASEVIGKNCQLVFSPAIPEDQLKELLAELQVHDYWSKEFERQTKEGSTIWVRSSLSTVRDKARNIIAYVAVSHDVTMQNKMQEEIMQLANLVKHTSDAIFSRGFDRRIISWNHGAEELFGYTKSEAIGKTAIELNLTNRSEAEVEAVEKILAEKGSWNAELYHKRKNGEAFYGAVSGSIVRAADGKPQAYYFSVRDVSTRKQLEDQLRQSNEVLEEKVQLRTAEILKTEQQYRHLFQNNPLPMWVFDTDSFHFLDVNAMAVRKYGYSREEFLGMTLMDIRPEQDRALFTKTKHDFDNLMDDEQVVWNHLKKDGTIIQVEISAHQIDFAGKRARLILANDVTERVKAERTLASSEKRFRTLIENSNDILSLMNADFKIVYRSPSALRITGWSNEETFQTAGYTNIHEDDRPAFHAKVAHIMKHPAKPVDVFFRARHKAGHFIWLEGTIVNLLEQEHVQAIVFNARDVSERIAAGAQLQASEKQFRHSMDNMLEGVQIIGFDWRYKYVNDAMARHGKFNKEDFIGHTVMERYPGIEETSIFKIYERCFQERKSIHVENEFVFPDKSVAWFELSILPVPEGIFVLSIDITDRKRAEEEVKQINTGLEEAVNQRTEELRKANEELEGFSYSISHDMRAPLRAIIGFSAILEEDYAGLLGEEGRRVTSVIKSNTLRMGNLIDDLLSFARTARMDIVKSNIDNNELVESIVESLDTKNHKNINWKIEDLPITFGEANMMRQVWQNIIQNAAKYAANSQPPVIEIGSYMENGETILFVKDNGVGFDERYKSKLFKVFQRLHSNEEFEGTGIGLAIVEKIISKHGGSVWAESKVGVGAAFYFTIPKQ